MRGICDLRLGWTDNWAQRCQKFRSGNRCAGARPLRFLLRLAYSIDDSQAGLADAVIRFSQHPHSRLTHGDHASTRSAGPRRMVLTSAGVGTALPSSAVTRNCDRAMPDVCVSVALAFRTRNSTRSPLPNTNRIAEAEHPVVDGGVVIHHFLISVRAAADVAIPVVEREKNSPDRSALDCGSGSIMKNPNSPVKVARFR